MSVCQLFSILCWLLPAANAAVLYVRSTDGSDADNGTTWALAKATLAGAFAIAAAGDTIYLSQVHAETQASAMTLTSPGTAPSPCKVICGNDAAEPPTAVATTATISITGTFDMNFVGFAYVYGITFVAGNSATCNINFASTSGWWWKFDACSLQLGTGTGTSARINVGANSISTDDQALELYNTTLSFGHTGQGVIIRTRCNWSNTASAVLGTVPTTLFLTPGSGNIGTTEVMGVDLSALASGKNLVTVSTANYADYLFVDCKLGASVALTTGTITGQGSTRVRFVNCDSGNTVTRYHKQNYAGTISQETTIVRTGGASDGTTPFSRKMVTTSRSQFYYPLESDWIVFWNESTSSTTLTIPVITDNVTLTDAEAWIEVEALTTSGFPLGGISSDRAANILTTPANQTTDATSTWTTTGLTTPVKQSLATTFTPAVKGLCRARVCLAKASTTMYFDPKIFSGQRQYMNITGVGNEGAVTTAAAGSN